MEFVENECACFKMIETHARVSSRTPADVKQVELWYYMADIICMLVDLFMFVLVRSGEEPLVGTQTLDKHTGSCFTNELQKSRRNHRSNIKIQRCDGDKNVA